jgi:hypothetical protein
MKLKAWAGCGADISLPMHTPLLLVPCLDFVYHRGTHDPCRVVFFGTYDTLISGTCRSQTISFHYYVLYVQAYHVRVRHRYISNERAHPLQTGLRVRLHRHTSMQINRFPSLSPGRYLFHQLRVCNNELNRPSAFGFLALILIWRYPELKTSRIPINPTISIR